MTTATCNLAEQLKAEWQTLKDQADASEQERDECRADIIVRYSNEGMTTRDIAACIEVSHGYVGYLIRYQRYINSLSTTVAKVPEGRFRAFWKQVRDPQATQGKRAVDPDYEAKCFKAIAEKVEAGEMPVKAERKPKAAGKSDIKALQKAARSIYENKLKSSLKSLKDLAGCDRSTFAPASISHHAQVIEKQVKELLKLVAGIGDEE